MVIGVDASRANRFPRSGVEWYAFNLLKEFYKLDEKNKFFLYTPNKLSADLLPDKDNFQEKILRWPFNRFWTLGRMGMEMTFRKPDVLFVPSHTFPIIGGRKNVITWHDIGYERYPENYTRWELASLKQGIKHALKIADQIIAISEFTKNEMIRIYRIDPDRIKVIHLGCDHSLWRPADQEAVREFKQKNNMQFPYFVFIGRLSLKKNLVGLIRMYNRFRELNKLPFNLILVGNESPVNHELNDEIKASPFKREIIKMGWRPSMDLPIILSGATGLILPSIYEGFGLPAVEAMACGCPVIASNSSSLPEVIDDAGLFAKTHDIEGFANQMLKLSHDPVLREKLVVKSLARAQHFNWQTCAKETLKILHEV
jgi:glycosyltransferase involved in cell wall biosynthesis